MKYSMYHQRRGEYTRKLREDHVALLYDIYKQYGLDYWRSDTDALPEDRGIRQYFISRMLWSFKLIEVYSLSKEEKSGYTSNQKQMIHYKITITGLKVLIQLGYKIKDEHIIVAARESLRN